MLVIFYNVLSIDGEYSINLNAESILLLQGYMTLSIVNMNYQLTVRVVQNSLGNFENFTWKVLTVFRFFL